MLNRLFPNNVRWKFRRTTGKTYMIRSSALIYVYTNRFMRAKLCQDRPGDPRPPCFRRQHETTTTWEIIDASGDLLDLLWPPLSATCILWLLLETCILHQWFMGKARPFLMLRLNHVISILHSSPGYEYFSDK